MMKRQCRRRIRLPSNLTGIMHKLLGGQSTTGSGLPLTRDMIQRAQLTCGLFSHYDDHTKRGI